jgi:hypothetical protein
MEDTQGAGEAVERGDFDRQFIDVVIDCREGERISLSDLACAIIAYVDFRLDERR